MNRRSFLKSIATACGAAVVCPAELLKPDPWIKAAALRKKNVAMDRNIICKARQQGMTATIFDEFATKRDKMYFAFRGEYY